MSDTRIGRHFCVYVIKFQKIRELDSGFVFQTIDYIVYIYGYKHNSDYVYAHKLVCAKNSVYLRTKNRAHEQTLIMRCFQLCS